MLIIYTDGSCLSNPGGAGGWAVCIIEENGTEFYLSGGDESTTNNRMELKAIIEAVSCVQKTYECVIYTDSQLCINCATGKWKRKSNLDLWQEYDSISESKKISYEWVKGHNGNKYNEIVDKMAFDEAKKIKK